MIGKLKGRLDSIGESSILLDVGGVGYLVFISGKTRAALPAYGEPLSLLIETQMREDSLKLFGFSSGDEQAWFRLLQNVPGVGAKLALAVLGSLSPAELSAAVSLRDAAALCRAPGIGKKVAERLITELKSKLPALSRDFAAPATGAARPAGGALPNAALDAVSALTNLGYKADEAGRAIAEAAKQADGAETAELIRLGLQILAKK